MRLYLGARDLKRGQDVAQEIGARAVQLDVTDEDSVQAAARLIHEEVGSLDVLINNAAISGRDVTGRGSSAVITGTGPPGAVEDAFAGVRRLQPEQCRAGFHRPMDLVRKELPGMGVSDSAMVVRLPARGRRHLMADEIPPWSHATPRA